MVAAITLVMWNRNRIVTGADVGVLRVKRAKFSRSEGKAASRKAAAEAPGAAAAPKPETEPAPPAPEKPE